MQRPCIWQRPTTTSAARRAREASSSPAPSPEKKLEPARVRLAHARHPAWRWRLKLARRTKATRRRREASRWGSVLVYGKGRQQPAWHDAREKQARVLRLLPRNSESRRACAWLMRGIRLGVGGGSLHVVPRPRAVGERRLAGAASLYTTKADHNQRGTARARSKLECCAYSRGTASAGARALGSCAAVSLAL